MDVALSLYSVFSTLVILILWRKGRGRKISRPVLKELEGLGFRIDSVLASAVSPNPNKELKLWCQDVEKMYAWICKNPDRFLNVRAWRNRARKIVDSAPVFIRKEQAYLEFEKECFRYFSYEKSEKLKFCGDCSVEIEASRNAVFTLHRHLWILARSLQAEH